MSPVGQGSQGLGKKTLLVNGDTCLNVTCRKLVSTDRIRVTIFIVANDRTLGS